ncbi:hypothetical protein Droror1_Dr00015972 [Drosera rotundifolia]
MGIVTNCWVEADAVDNAGGLLLVWDPASFVMEGRKTGSNWILLWGKWCNPAFNCCFVLVYGPNSRQDRARVWDEIVQARGLNNYPVICFGDFNEVLKPEERSSYRASVQGMAEFVPFIDLLGVIELQLIGQKYTWYRRASQSRIN